MNMTSVPPAVRRGAALAATLAAFLALGLGPAPATSAADSTNPPSAATTGAAAAVGTARTLEAKLADTRAHLAAFESTGLTNVPAGVSLQEVWTRRAGLHRLAWLYEQELSNISALEKIRSRKDEAARQAQAWTRFTEPPPYSVLLTDSLREEIQAEKQKIQNTDAAIPALDKLVEENRQTLKLAEEKIRQINEQLEGAKDATLTTRLAWQRELQQLNSQVAAASLSVVESERQLDQELLAESRTRLGLLQRQLAIADSGATFSQEDLDQVCARIDRLREQFEMEMTQAQTRRATAVQRLESAREELRQKTSSRASELVSAREADLDAADTAISVSRLMLQGTSLERAMWELRFASRDSRSVEKLTDARRRLDAFIRRLDLWIQPVRQQLELASRQIQLQNGRLNASPGEGELRPLAQQRLDALHEQEQWLLRAVRGMETVQRLGQRWAEELRQETARLPIFGRLRNLFADTSSFFERLWTFEIFTAQDTITVDGQKITGSRSVTVGKIALAVLILVAGYWVTGWLSRFSERVVLRRLKVDPNQATLVRRWLRAFLLLCLVMFSLVSVKIPLTVFAFAGGALAIGLGFGMQTLLKNFVSGLILLFERPFRVGDVLDVGGQKGTVTSIGLRASVLQLWDGTETLIPNSSLLENNVTNWTYTNRKVRFEVAVGVAYGSDPRRVMKLLAEAAERHGRVEKDPPPLVLFTEFGESTLNFQLRFWVDVTTANSAQTSSDLRLMIAGLFSEAGIEIAFPQRDVHLKTAEPLPVTVVPTTPALTDGTLRLGLADPTPRPPN
jgi:potassium-dependent mechanosensitive channel